MSEAPFARLRPFLPNKPRGVHRVGDRRVISGIVVDGRLTVENPFRQPPSP